MKDLQVALVQPNFKIGGGSFVGYWLPYSVGCLWSYANQYEWVQNSFNLKEIIFKREQPSNVVDRLQDCKVAFFSNYMWNWEYNKALAKILKEKSPDVKIVFGGPQVTEFIS